MVHFDLTPLYRTTVGFDRLGSLFDTLGSLDKDAPSYPPYNIELVDENAYRITMAVAGFASDDLHVEAKENTLTIRGDKQSEKEESTFLHRGIAARSFERRFQLADYVVVKGAGLENGLLLQSFYKIWTCKEAVLKALGTGITKHLKEFSIESSNERYLIHTEPDCVLPVLASVVAHSIEVPSGYAGCYALA